MITLRNLSKTYQTQTGPREVLKNINLKVLKGEKIGILGSNGAGKSTLIRLISGAELPTRGEITKEMSISWPLAFSGAFQGSLTGLDNVKFICRIYNSEILPAINFVRDFSELGTYLKEPVKSYSSGMRARLAFAVSLAINFDCFLIDEVVAVGDQRFHEKCRIELFEKRAQSAMIIVSHDAGYIREHCDKAAVLDSGFLHNFNTVNDAYVFYQKLILK